MKKVKKPTIKSLQQELKTCRELSAMRYNDWMKAIKERDDWQQSAKAHVDTTMLNERIRLASSIGQMMDTVCQTVKYVIGKEVM
jgi:nucleoside 2-deoxyribosyltransferase